jgi:lysophospholipase L1-like esterase
VSFYLPHRFEVTSENFVTRHTIAKQTSYISAAGTGDLTGVGVMPNNTAVTLSWYFVHTLEVLATDDTGVIVALGDSIADANGSTPDMNFRWPDELAKRLHARLGGRPMGVLNQGTGGDRVIWDSPPPPLGGNDSGLRRFDRDVVAAPGVTHVIVLLGVNDLRNGGGRPDNPATAVTADDVIDGYKQMIARAHSSGLKIYGATLLPWWRSIFTNDNWTQQKWQKSQDINKWIRTSGAFDAVIDFDKCVANPSDPRTMLDVYDSGDHLHPSDRGYVHLGECVELSLFK